ncbi:tetratricopeptide repeat protein [Rhodohalobacter sp. 614A]|uniref:tetratricopeptide repeat protein n=1 Tax=Rhodohalobacter sp. 614A TaxID=2908649 RepID=UPI001F421C82|nr:tetratricopeptide repeat protein [Rhodohalobacter sp. 614A]
MSFEEKHKEGYELLHEKDLDKSLDIARRLQKMRPDAAEGYTLEGEVMQKLNQWEQSIKSLNEAIELDSDNGRLYNLRGYAYLNEDHLEKAREDFDHAIALDNLASAHRNVVLYKLMSGKGQEAIAYLLDRIRSEPRDVENWILMGDLMKKGGHDQKAQTYYEQALKMDPDNVYAKDQLGQ